MPSRASVTHISSRLQALECPSAPQIVRFWKLLLVSPFLSFIGLTWLIYSGILHQRRSLSNRDLLFLRHGGNERELEALFKFLSESGQESQLESLCLIERAPVSMKGIDHILTQLQSPSFSRLSSLQVPCPLLPSLQGLTSLTKLTVELMLEELPIWQQLGMLDHKWQLPRTGSLTELNVRFEDRLQAYFPHREHFYAVCLPIAPNGPLRNLKVLRINVHFKHFMGELSFATMCPDLEELELSGRADHAQDFSSLTIPSNIKKLVFTVAQCWHCYDFPIDFTLLTNLIDLTVLHQSGQRKGSEIGPWGVYGVHEHPWPLEPLLSLPSSVARLRIVSADRLHKWNTLYETFLIQLATLKKAQLSLHVLDLTSIPMSLQVATLLKEGYPNAEVLYRLREYDSIRPLRSDELPHDYFAATMIGRSAPLAPEDGIFYNAPYNIGDLLPCTLCGVMVGENAIEDHKTEICVSRKVRCAQQACPFVGSIAECHKHSQKCPFYLVKCFECLATMPLSEYHEHANKHNEILRVMSLKYLSRPAFESLRVQQCSSCDQEVPNFGKAAHSCTFSKPSKVLLHGPIPPRKKSLAPLDN